MKQIIDGNHVKRGETAHIVTLQALFRLHKEAFLQQHPHLKQSLEDAAAKLDQACKQMERKKIEEAHAEMAHTIESLHIVIEIRKIDAIEAKQPLFKVMRLVRANDNEIMQFIRAIRTADWELHLIALETFTKYFFAHDKLNYARMIPLYLAEIKSLKGSEPNI